MELSSATSVHEKSLAVFEFKKSKSKKVQHSHNIPLLWSEPVLHITYINNLTDHVQGSFSRFEDAPIKDSLWTSTPTCITIPSLETSILCSYFV